MHPETSCQLCCPVINIAMSNNFKHSHVHFTHFFSEIPLDLVTQTLLPDYILAMEKNREDASNAYCFFYKEIKIFEHFEDKIYDKK